MFIDCEFYKEDCFNKQSSLSHKANTLTLYIVSGVHPTVEYEIAPLTQLDKKLVL
jgi:hypothetical protein